MSSPAPSRATTARSRVSRPTRASIAPGDCFVALKGEKFDAHDFLREAVDRGAAAVVVSRPERTVGLGVPVFAVRDTLGALGALARYRRRAWNGTVIGVGGSNGKTTTKELIRATLGATLTVHATTGNLNNLIGVPLTLLRDARRLGRRGDRDGDERSGRDGEAARDRRAGHCR